MTTQTLAQSRVGILGDGVEAMSVVAWLERMGSAPPPRVVSRARPQLLGASPAGLMLPSPAASYDWRDERDLSSLDDCDVVVRSPGVRLTHPLLARAAADSRTVTSCTNIFMRDAAERGFPVIGVTGSKGKSTTTLLIQALLEQRGLRVAVAGNIGRPALDLLPSDLASLDVVVYEMSSYQCSDLTTGPAHAVLLDLFPEHMDWHGSVHAYYEAKSRIAHHQPSPSRVVFGEHVREVLDMHGMSIGGRAVNTPSDYHFRDGAFYHGARRLFDAGAGQLRGDHNMANACVALAALEPFGVEWSDLERVLATFRGLPHRLEVVGTIQGIEWIDDSASTAPEAAVAALRTLGGHVETLITGGLDRGYDVGGLARYLAETEVRTIVCLPDTGWILAERLALEGGGALGGAVVRVARVEEAVRIAAGCTSPGGVCLFSPGAPSYGQFKNFVERGEVFQRAVADLGVGRDV